MEPDSIQIEINHLRKRICELEQQCADFQSILKDPDELERIIAKLRAEKEDETDHCM